MSDDEYNTTGLHCAASTTAARGSSAPRLRLVAARGTTMQTVPMEERRHDVRRNMEGMKMNIVERLATVVARFVVGFGIGLALVCAVVIVTTRPALEPATVARPVEVIRLDPVSVTISAERFQAIRAQMIVDSLLVQTRGEAPLADG